MGRVIQQLKNKTEGKVITRVLWMVIAQTLEDINGYAINQLKLEWLLNTAADQRDKNCANGKRMTVDHSVLLFDKFWFTVGLITFHSFCQLRYVDVDVHFYGISGSFGLAMGILAHGKLTKCEPIGSVQLACNAAEMPQTM